MNRLLIIIVLLIFSSMLLAGKIYKWVDDEGQIHYSSQKPLGQTVETVKVNKAPVVSETAASELDAVEPDKPAVESKEDVAAAAAAKAQLAKADKVNRKKMCDQARSNMASLNASIRVNTVDEKTGQSVRMTDDQRVAAMKNAQMGIKEYCQ